MNNINPVRKGLLVASLLVFAAAAVAAPETNESAAAEKSPERVRTEKAIKDAASDAIESLKADNKLDLDIRLIGPNSIKIAGRK